jgi:5-methylcytosine-specific restriction endonuclease McrA
MVTSRTGTAAWKAVVRQVRQIGRDRGMPCWLCKGVRGPIDYRTQAEADRDARLTGEWWLIGAHRPLGLSVDHVVPHVAGGPDTLENAAPSHVVCNAEAGAKDATKRPTTRQPRQQRVVGHWKPIDGGPQALPGYDVPGRRTGSHVFVEGGGGRPGSAPPLSPPWA